MKVENIEESDFSDKDEEYKVTGKKIQEECKACGKGSDKNHICQCLNTRK